MTSDSLNAHSLITPDHDLAAEQHAVFSACKLPRKHLDHIRREIRGHQDDVHRKALELARKNLHADPLIPYLLRKIDEEFADPSLENLEREQLFDLLEQLQDLISGVVHHKDDRVLKDLEAQRRFIEELTY